MCIYTHRTHTHINIYIYIYIHIHIHRVFHVYSLEMQGHPKLLASAASGGLHENGSDVSGIAASRLHALDAKDQPLRGGLLSLVEPGLGWDGLQKHGINGSKPSVAWATLTFRAPALNKEFAFESF